MPLCRVEYVHEVHDAHSIFGSSATAPAYLDQSHAMLTPAAKGHQTSSGGTAVSDVTDVVPVY